MNSQLKVVNAFINKSDLLRRIVTKLLHVHDQHLLYGDDNNFGGIFNRHLYLNHQFIGSNDYDNIDFQERGINFGDDHPNNNSMRFLLNKNNNAG